jgi:3-methyl-2-oxobutanoate hydroxymethyltransferase
MKESGCEAVKIEGGAEIQESVKMILSAGIPVMGHLGLTPQSVNKFGGYGIRAKEDAEAQKLLDDAKLLEELGCFAIVLEKIPAALAAKVAQSVSIPIIGIGAGNGVDGQVLVCNDMLGMNQGFKPKFLRVYADLATTINDAMQSYIADVKSSDFPNAAESY